MSSRLTLSTDRRAVLFGLGATAAAATFAPFVTATAASATPAGAGAAASIGAPMPAVYWNLPYNDFTGVVSSLKIAKRKAETVFKDLDPHAELLAG